MFIAKVFYDRETRTGTIVVKSMALNPNGGGERYELKNYALSFFMFSVVLIYYSKESNFLGHIIIPEQRSAITD